MSIDKMSKDATLCTVRIEIGKFPINYQNDLLLEVGATLFSYQQLTSCAKIIYENKEIAECDLIALENKKLMLRIINTQRHNRISKAAHRD